MKIKSLFILSLLAVGINAFAEETKVAGVIFDGNPTTKKATVKAISTGMGDAAAATITIPATYTDGDGNLMAVTGFSANWQKQTGSYKNVEDLVTAITVDVTNIAPADLNGAFAGLNKLATVTLKGTYADADYTIGYNSYDGKGATSVTTVNLKDLKGKAKVIIDGTAFKTVTTVTTVTLPEQTTEISADAFNGASALTAIDLKSVTKIGANAFKGCAALATVNFSNATALTEIGANAFDGVPFKAAAATTIDLDLSGATALKTVATTSFPAIAYTSVKLRGTAIDNANFAKVPTWLTGATASLTEITFPDEITTIPAMGAFTALEAVGLPKNLETIGDNAFKDCSALKNIKIKSHIRLIGKNAFQNCAALANINFSEANALEEIDKLAFDGTPITTIDLSACEKLVYVSSTAFPQNAYTSVKLNGTNLVFVDGGGVYTDRFSSYFANILAGSKASLEEITLPSGLKNIKADQFNGFTALKTIALPKVLETIGASAFANSGLTSIKIRENVTTIDATAFANCADLETVNFSAAAELTTIGNNAFFNDPKLLTLDLSGAVKLATIAANSFPANAYTSVLLSGTALDDANFANFNFSGAAASLTEVTLPSGITTIPANKFQNFSALTSVSLPKAVTTIGNYAFENSALTAVKIRENVTTIGAAAFANCADLAIVNFTEAAALTTIGGSAFRSTAIKEAVLPATVTTMVGGFQFADCAKLKSFSAKGLIGDLPNNILQNCVKLTGVVIPAGATGIGASAFEGCEALATVTFKFEEGDNALATNGIGASAFEGCKALAALDLSTTKLLALDQADIFKGCTALAEITFPETLTALGDGAGTADGLFAACPIENLDASNVILSDNLFGEYYDADLDVNSARDADHANTTLKTVKIGGEIPANCFAYCTALASVEYFDMGSALWSPSDVDAYAFEHCTGLKTFTYEPTEKVTALIVDDDAFHGCIPFVKFVTNSNYMDIVAAVNDSKAPVNATFGDASITIVKTVQDKKNANQAFAKYYNDTYPVRFSAEDCKVFTAYADGETVYYQACRTFEGEYHIPASIPVIIKTSEPTEVTYEIGAWENSIGWNDLYSAQEGDDLAAVQDHMHPNYNAWTYGGLSAGEYVYRLTNTADQGFGFTFFTGTTIKEGQFFIASEKKPAGAGRLNEVWLDEDGNVIEGEATAIQNMKSLDQNDGAIYNLQGVRVQKAQKGLYIQNGKKIFVK